MTKHLRSLHYTILPALFLLLFATACLENDKEDDPAPATIIGKWNILKYYYYYNTGSKTESPAGGNWTLNTNGTSIISAADTIIRSGTFTHDVEKKLIKVKWDDDTTHIDFNIITLTGSDLTIEFGNNPVEGYQLRK